MEKALRCWVSTGDPLLRTIQVKQGFDGDERRDRSADIEPG